MITCPHCEFENTDGVVFCANCRTNVHWLPVQRELETAAALQERLTDAIRKRERWKSFCVGSWIAFVCMFLFCMASWGLPFGLLGFIYLSFFAGPILIIVSFLYFCAREDIKQAQDKLNDVHS